MRSLGQLLAIRSMRGELSDVTWGEFLRTLHAHDLDKLRVFVRTDGSAPSMHQVKALAHELGSRPVRFAIVSDDGRVRFVTSALAMMIKRIRSFSVAHLSEAFAYLELTADEARFALSFVDDASTPPPARDPDAH